MSQLSHRVPSLREIPATTTWKKGDVLVLFGELFNRGYANGLVEAAERRGMTVIRGTVGRREKDGTLRPLNADELAMQTQPLVNVPLEAGFDMEMLSSGQTIIDMMKDVKLTDWENFKVPHAQLLEAKEKGANRFAAQVRTYLATLEPLLPAEANVHFAHLMAGGVPRARIVMPLMNRVFKGTGDRYLQSETFWKSGLGEVARESFLAVSADTFKILIDESAALRSKLEKSGRHVSYSGYGYHGTEVMIKNEYQWQSYAPYLQGWAKIQLENVAKDAFQRGIKAAVYNCPEILTNSSSIFQGVEVPLYPLLKALKHEGPSSAKTKKLWDDCQALLKPEVKIADVLRWCEECLSAPEVQAQSELDLWPQHNTAKQMETLLATSERIIGAHISDKNLMTAVLSEEVFDACGEAMLADAAAPQQPVSWINHDLVARWAVRT